MPAYADAVSLGSNQQVKILVVEDDRIDREIYKQCLRESAAAKFEFADAGSANEGIELIRTFMPDCVLLDYDLPDGSGLDVLAQFGEEGPPSAVVMLTAFGGEDLDVRAMKAGVTDYLPKRQVSVVSLAHAVTNAIQKFEMRRRIEQHPAALESSERRYETLLEAIPQIVWTADVDGVMQYTNRRWLEYTGFPMDRPSRVGWDAVLHPDDRERTWRAWKAAAESGSLFEIEHRLLRAADRSYRWHLVRAAPMKNGAGKIVNWFGTCTDIEDRKRAERDTLEREKLEGIGLLAGGIAHEFNNLLMSILGGASLVVESLPGNHSCQQILKQVLCAGEHAAALTRKMLAYSGQGNFFLEAINLDHFIGDVCRYLLPSIPGRIHFRFDGSCSPLPVETDAEQLRLVISELVMNAIDAIGDAESGKIAVRSSLAQIDPALDRDGNLAVGLAKGVQFIAIDVEDTGCGMDEALQAKIFDPFFSTKFIGRGLGLSAVKGFVRSNGGAICVRSRPAAGTIVQLLLPAAAQQDCFKSNGVDY